MRNFFKSENILQLRELALKEVALRVEKKVENEVVENIGLRHERFLACISSQEKTPRKLIRKVARLATHYNSKFVVLHVQTRHESADRIPLAKQRYLILSWHQNWAERYFKFNRTTLSEPSSMFAGKGRLARFAWENPTSSCSRTCVLPFDTRGY